MKRYILCFMMVLMMFTCHSPDQPTFQSFIGLHHVPVITGIWYVGSSNFGGYFVEKWGNPSYPMPGVKDEYRRINVYPNPYFASSPLDTSPTNRFIMFNHLPDKVAIHIYKGIWFTQEPPPNPVVIDGGIVAKSVKPIRTLHHQSESQFEKWDLKDNSGNYISSGFYRAYFVSEQDELLNWVDMYILMPFDCATWVDPTGMLPPDWHFGVDENGEWYDICNGE